MLVEEDSKNKAHDTISISLVIELSAVIVLFLIACTLVGCIDWSWYEWIESLPIYMAYAIGLFLAWSPLVFSILSITLSAITIDMEAKQEIPYKVIAILFGIGIIITWLFELYFSVGTC